jgi:hypothetical protein
MCCTIRSLVPLGQIRVQTASVVLPATHFRVSRAQPQRRFDTLESVLAVAKESLPVTNRGVSVGVVRVLGNSGLGFCDRRFPLMLRMEDPSLYS